MLIAFDKQMLSFAGNATDEKAWYRILPKPAVFDCKDRETEIATWRDWAWTFEQYLGSLDANFVGDIKTLRANPSTEVDMSVQTDSEKRRGVFLYGLLASLWKQRPLLVLKQVMDCNGFEAYRQVIQSNEPMNKYVIAGADHELASLQQPKLLPEPDSEARECLCRVREVGQQSW